MGRYKIVRVSRGTLRRHFRQLGLETPKESGYMVEYRGRRRCGPGTPPDCEWTEILAYLDLFGREVARAERHLRADGSVGASGKADPKRVLVADTLYIAHRD
jgi:hypothetical protein